MEDWKLIADFPNYDVSSLGNIRNNKTGKQMKLCVKSGYYHVCFVNDNSKKSFKVHRLVAMAFIENPEHKLEVNHKDKNKTNVKYLAYLASSKDVGISHTNKGKL